MRRIWLVRYVVEGVGKIYLSGSAAASERNICRRFCLMRPVLRAVFRFLSCALYRHARLFFCPFLRKVCAARRLFGLCRSYAGLFCCCYDLLVNNLICRRRCSVDALQCCGQLLCNRRYRRAPRSCCIALSDGIKGVLQRCGDGLQRCLPCAFVVVLSYALQGACEGVLNSCYSLPSEAGCVTGSDCRESLFALRLRKLCRLLRRDRSCLCVCRYFSERLDKQCDGIIPRAFFIRLAVVVKMNRQKHICVVWRLHLVKIKKSAYW